MENLSRAFRAIKGLILAMMLRTIVRWGREPGANLLEDAKMAASQFQPHSPNLFIYRVAAIGAASGFLALAPRPAPAEPFVCQGFFAKSPDNGALSPLFSPAARFPAAQIALGPGPEFTDAVAGLGKSLSDNPSLLTVFKQALVSGEAGPGRQLNWNEIFFGMLLPTEYAIRFRRPLSERP
jgi:hypothetical protein